jgi:hypothetical protein
MAKVRDYAPYNNMLVRIQDPTCSFYATAYDWSNRFTRSLKEDARPMLILAPMHPVMLVYSLDQTEGPDLPDELNRFARFEGEWNPDWLRRIIGNAAKHDHIRVDFKTLSSTNAGFATPVRHASGNRHSGPAVFRPRLFHRHYLGRGVFHCAAKRRVGACWRRCSSSRLNHGNDRDVSQCAQVELCLLTNRKCWALCGVVQLLVQ